MAPISEKRAKARRKLTEGEFTAGEEDAAQI
jgi:hypothetical protein